MSVNLRLKVRFPNGDEKSIPFKGKDVIIGRDPNCDLVVDDPDVSLKHMVLKYFETDKLILANLSRKPVRVYGEPVKDTFEVTPDTTIQIGNTYICVEPPDDDAVVRFTLDVDSIDFQSNQSIEDTVGEKDVPPETRVMILQKDLTTRRAGTDSLQTLLTRVADVLKAENGIIFVKSGKSWEIKAIRITRGTKLNVPENLVDTILADNSVFLLEKKDKTLKSALKKAGVGSALGCTLQDIPDFKGGIYLDRGLNRESFNAQDLILLNHIADMISESFRSQLMRQEVRQERDGLRTERELWFNLLSEESDLPVKSSNRKYQQLLYKVLRIASTDNPVLFYGNLGTSRSILARRVHFSSSRRDAPFIEIQCADIPQTMMEEQLFGLELPGDRPSAPTRKGLLELGNKGTVYLNEIAALPLTIQNKLVSLLKDRKLKRCGAQDAIPLDIRLVASTSVETSRMNTAGRLSSELENLFDGMILEIPLLKNRTEDIMPLARYFMRQFLPTNRTVPEFSQEVIGILETYAWPENIAELRRVMLWISAVCADNRVEIGDLPRNFLEQPSFVTNADMTLREQMDLFEMEIIRSALERNKNIVTRAAKELGLSESTLRYRMQRLAL